MTFGDRGTRKYLAGVIAILALAFTSLGMAAGSPSAVGTVRSGAASPRTFTASALCSKAAATEVVKRLHMGEADFIPNPVWAVICGAFMGPGSQTMVVSLASGGTSVPFEGWAVFRLAGGTWQLVKRPGNGAQVSAAGSDIRETVSILRPGDQRCCPTGGTRSRIWHWNGSSFTVGPWKQAASPRPSTGTTATLRIPLFLSPSRNLFCNLQDDGAAACQSRNPPLSAYMRSDGNFSVCRGSRCVGTGKFGAGIPTLGYGEQTEYVYYRCRSEQAGITCIVVDRGAKGYGKGFRISREGVKRVSP